MVIQEFTREAIAGSTTTPSVTAMALRLAVSWGRCSSTTWPLPIAPWATENIGPRLLALYRIAAAMSPAYTAGDFDAPPA
jgi:hypothetical protein